MEQRRHRRWCSFKINQYSGHWKGNQVWGNRKDRLKKDQTTEGQVPPRGCWQNDVASLLMIVGSWGKAPREVIYSQLPHSNVACIFESTQKRARGERAGSGEKGVVQRHWWKQRRVVKGRMQQSWDVSFRRGPHLGGGYKMAEVRGTAPFSLPGAVKC